MSKASFLDSASTTELREQVEGDGSRQAAHVVAQNFCIQSMHEWSWQGRLLGLHVFRMCRGGMQSSTLLHITQVSHKIGYCSLDRTDLYDDHQHVAWFGLQGLQHLGPCAALCPGAVDGEAELGA